MHTCKTLQASGLWDVKKCCQECHSGKPTILCRGMGTYPWIHGKQARLCSSAYWHFYGLRHDPSAQGLSTYLTDNGGIPLI